MKNCTQCKHADWQRTAAGKLHPSGDGWCRYPYKVPPLPQAIRWLSEPVTSYGQINRRKELPGHCAYWSER